MGDRRPKLPSPQITVVVRIQHLFKAHKTSTGAAVRQTTDPPPGQGTSSSRVGVTLHSAYQYQSNPGEPAHNSAFMPPKQYCNPAPMGRARQHHRKTVPTRTALPPPRFCPTSSMCQISLPNGAGLTVARAPARKKITGSPQQRGTQTEV
jgi:hypothetical protein